MTVTQLPSLISEYYGATVTVNCYAVGKPQPTITWYKDDVILSSNGGIQVTQSIVNSTTISILTITSLTNSNEGMYKCSGSNTLPNGTVTHSSSFTLEVVGSKSHMNYYTVKISHTSLFIHCQCYFPYYSNCSELHRGCIKFNSDLSFMGCSNGVWNCHISLHCRN